MPKYVWHDFYLSLRRDIETNYNSGERYLTVRDIATKFKVSLQTAQRGVTRLAQERIVSSKPRAGIVVCDKEQVSPALQGKRVLLITSQRDRRFYTSFLAGVRSCFESVGVEVNFMVNDFPSETSLAFGDHLLSMRADGIIALAFPHSSLPFYHVMREGQDIVSDIILDDLPSLPAVQTDNYSHSFEAGRILGTHDCERYYMIGYDPMAGNKRWEGFCDGVRKTRHGSHFDGQRPGAADAAAPGGGRLDTPPTAALGNQSGTAEHITYICLAEDNAIGNVVNALLSHSKDGAFFIADWSASYLFGALCLQEGVQPSMTLVYDADDAYFCLQGLEPIRAVAPPFHELGRRLGNTLLAKWQADSFPRPLQRKI